MNHWKFHLVKKYGGYLVHQTEVIFWTSGKSIYKVSIEDIIMKIILTNQMEVACGGHLILKKPIEAPGFIQRKKKCRPVESKFIKISM